MRGLPVSVFLPVASLESRQLTLRIDRLQHQLRFCDELVLLGDTQHAFAQQAMDAVRLPESNIRLVLSQPSKASQYNAAAEHAQGSVFLFLPDGFEGWGTPDWDDFLNTLEQQHAQVQRLWGTWAPQRAGHAKGWRKVWAGFCQAWCTWRKAVNPQHPLFVSKFLFQAVGGFPVNQKHPWVGLAKRLKKTRGGCFVRA
jgi:hypothetical protein